MPVSELPSSTLCSWLFHVFLGGELNGIAVYGILLSEWLRETASAGIFQCNTLWRFHFLPLILHWQLSFSPSLKSHFQSLMAVMLLRSLDSYSKCHWHNGRQPLASFDHPCCVREQLEPKQWGMCVCAPLAPLLGCHSQAKLHDRKSKIHFQIVFLLFLVLNSQAVESVCVYVCVYSLKRWVSTVSASQTQPSLALP